MKFASVLHTCPLSADTHTVMDVPSLPNLKSFKYVFPGPGFFNQVSGQDLGVQIVVSSCLQASPR